MSVLNLLLALAALILAIVAIATRQQGRIRRLEAQVWWLKDALDDLGAGRPEAKPEERPTADAARAAPTETRAEPGTEGETPPSEPAVEPAAEPAPETPAIFEPLARRVTGAGRPQETLEQALTARWLVWLGGLALALAVAFLFKFAIDQGWLTPLVRVALGLAAAVLLLSLGEWLRSRAEREPESALPYYVPAALTAAGSFAAFGSIYAAHVLYQLIGAPGAFLVLGVIALGAVALSLLHGAFFAVLGIVAAFSVPALIGMPEPKAWPVFLYLTAVVAAGAGVTRYRRWWWLSFLILAGAALWPMLWMAVPELPNEVLVLAAYLLVLLGLLLWAADLDRPGAGEESPEHGFLALPAVPADQVALLSIAVIGGAMFVLVRTAGYDFVSLAALWLYVLATLGTGRRQQVFDVAPWCAALPVLAAFATWKLAYLVPRIAPGADLGPPVPEPYNETVWWSALAFGLLFGLGGFAGLWGARRPWRWGLTAAVPSLLVFFSAYALTSQFERSLIWAAVALLLGGVYLAACAAVARYRETEGMTGALGALSFGVTASVALAVALSLFQAWLTVALAVQLALVAWIHTRLPLGFLRIAVLVLAAAVFVRLVLNPAVFEYPLSQTPILNWLLYGYGIPAGAFFLGAYWLRGTQPEAIEGLLRACGMIFVVWLIGLEIHSVMAPGDAPRLDHTAFDFRERSVLTLAWLTLAAGFYRLLPYRSGDVVFLWGGRALAIVALVLAVFGQVMIENPLWIGIDVGVEPILDWLLAAYLLPSLVLAVGHRITRRQDLQIDALVARIGAAGFAFLWLTLEIRHLFQGPILAGGATSDAEWYTYSAAWLAFGAILLALGIWRRSTALRYASLAIVMVAVLKVFIWDMSAITGLWRVLSFLALGLMLVAIGYFYRRYVFPKRADSPAG